MSTNIDDLIAQLTTGSAMPHPSLVEGLLAAGEEAVGPLRERLRNDECEPLHTMAFSVICRLLGDLGAREAVPDLIQAFRDNDDDVIEDVGRALFVLGPEDVVEPLIEVIGDGSLTWYQRGVATEVLQSLAWHHEEVRPRITGVLREQLDDYMARPDPLSEDQEARVTSLCSALAYLADPESLAVIRAAYKRHLIDEFMIRWRDVKEIYDRGGQDAHWLHGDQSLREYPSEYRGWHQWQGAVGSVGPSEPVGPVGPVGPSEPVRRAKLGRNDPCWCGSGKKYKHCHLRAGNQESGLL